MENSQQLVQQSFTSCRDYSFRLLLFFYFRCLRPFRAYDTTCNIKFLRRSYLSPRGGERWVWCTRAFINSKSFDWMGHTLPRERRDRDAHRGQTFGRCPLWSWSLHFIRYAKTWSIVETIPLHLYSAPLTLYRAIARCQKTSLVFYI